MRQKMVENSSGILIGGTSHVGKTSLADELSTCLATSIISTDDLGRHPGRPWPTVRPQVAEFYDRLSIETIHWLLKIHHENMWPLIQQKISDQTERTGRFIIEGSALRPEYLSEVPADRIRTIFLFADDEFLEERMRKEANIHRADGIDPAISDKFIERSLRENAEMSAQAHRLGIRCVNVSMADELNALKEELRSVLAAEATPSG